MQKERKKSNKQFAARTLLQLVHTHIETSE
jgi:hypothetical protein